MIDRETEVLSKCTELLTELDDNAKFRIVKYLIERFGIINNTTANNKNNFTNQPPQLVINADVHSFDYTEETNTNEDYPSLHELLVKNYPKTETDWILCYAFFASQYGKNTFTKENIIEKYKDNNKFSKSNCTNLTKNINSCIKKDWFKTINKDTYTLKQNGLSYVQEILKGNSTSKEIKRTNKTKKPNSENK